MTSPVKVEENVPGYDIKTGTLGYLLSWSCVIPDLEESLTQAFTDLRSVAVPNQPRIGAMWGASGQQPCRGCRVREMGVNLHRTSDS
jgi:hypothetical protein